MITINGRIKRFVWLRMNVISTFFLVNLKIFICGFFKNDLGVSEENCKNWALFKLKGYILHINNQIKLKSVMMILKFLSVF